MISTPRTPADVPEPGSAEELGRFAALQAKLGPLAQRVLSDQRASQTVVVVPSLTLDIEELAKIPGAHHYEERLLCMLMLLRLPRTNVVYVTSQHIATAVVDYYLHLLPGIPLRHARSRLTLLSCHDASDVPLTQKILDRPRLVERIRAAIIDPEAAHLTCFNSTALERSLAVRLGIPLYGNDPQLNYLGTKSGSREAFREAGIPLPDGFEHLRDGDDVVDAVVELKRRKPGLRRAAIKLDEGFSGEGNAVFPYEGAPEGEGSCTLGQGRVAGTHQVRGSGRDLGALQSEVRGDGRHRGVLAGGGRGALAFRTVPHQSPRRGERCLHPRPSPGRALRPDLPRQYVPRRRRVQPRHQGGRRQGRRGAKGTRCLGKVRHRLYLRQARRGLGARGYRDQPPQGRHHASVPDPAFPDGRYLRRE